MNLRRPFAAAAVVATLAVACGQAAEVLAPNLALREAAEATARETKSSFTIRLVGEDADVLALFLHGDTPGPGAEGEAPTAEDQKGVDLLRDSQISFARDPGRSDSAADDSFAAVLDLGDLGEAVELRVVDEHFYMRADVPGIAKLFEADPGALDAFAAGATEAGFGFAKDAIAGRWLSADLKALAGVVPGAKAPAEGVPSLGALQGKALMDAFGKTFGEDVAVKRLDKEDAGQRYSLTVPIKRVYEKLLPALRGMGVPAAGLPLDSAQIPDRSVAADVWVADDRIKRAELNLSQFADEAVGRVALRVDVAKLNRDIKAPDGAVEVDLASIIGQFMAGFMGGEPGFS